jgi:hypothetical protein
MWDENFEKFLYEGLEAKDGYTLSEAEVALQKYFNQIMRGTKPSKDNAKVFYGIRAGALTLLSTLYNRSIEEVLDASYKIGIAKNRDYGTDNILKYGVVGLIVRLNDKISRAVNLLKDGTTPLVADEKVEDTIMDMVNYATYGIMLCNGVWL